MKFLFIRGMFFTACLSMLCSTVASPSEIHLHQPKVFFSTQITANQQNTLLEILQEESKSRGNMRWQRVKGWGNGSEPILAIVFSREKEFAGIALPQMRGQNPAETHPEGFRIVTLKRAGRTTIWLIAADFRGMVFGIGKLLRMTRFFGDNCFLPEKIEMATAPQQMIRGHQLGYRNLANSYDAWDVAQYEKYIRELALFGTNAIENIPFGQNNDSVHMLIPRQEMRIRLSEICQKYDLDYWVFTPATFDLTNAEKRQAMLQKHEDFYKKCPRLDNVFFPGGDPGDNHPREVMPFLSTLSKRLRKYHPKAGVWISLQGFSAEEIDYFYTYLEQHNPDWLRGVVSGPSSPPVAETRFRLPSRYFHRHYPDITHNFCCDYPVPNWDQVFAMTIGREGINPMPNFYARIHQKYSPYTDGFVAYSDGAHDDVNKIIWSQKGWNSDQTVWQIMLDYCNFFFGAEVCESAANGILALENNWKGPITENGGIEATFEFWRNLEKKYPQLSQNWRWQMLVLRAYYDTYQRRRKIYEQGLEKKANAILGQAAEIGSEHVMELALTTVEKAKTEPVSQDLLQKITVLCDSLFHSIGLQSDMQKYQAAGAQRGCILQFVNSPLNNRWWLADEFEKIKILPTESEKLKQLAIIRNWESPGPGSFYDNISSIDNGPRVKSIQYDACDVAWWDGGYSRARLSSQLFQNSPVLQYDDLDFNGRYILRIAGQGDALLRADGERLEPILYNKGRGEFKEFVVPRHIVRDGRMRLTFDIPEESYLNWRQYSHISDVWLIKK